MSGYCRELRCRFGYFEVGIVWFLDRMEFFLGALVLELLLAHVPLGTLTPRW